METGAQSASAGSARSEAGRPRVFAKRRGLDAEVIDKFCERAILALVLGILVWGPVATGATKNSQFSVILALGVLIVPFWIARVWFRKQYRFLFPPFAWTVLAFTGYAIWRYTQADIEYTARMELLQVLLYALLFFAVVDNLTRQESIQIILFTLIGLGMLLSFYAIYQYFTESNYVLWFPKEPAYKGRGSATYVCPNHLAGFLEMILPVALAYTITGRYKPLTKVFLGYAAVAILAGIGVTISRGAYIAAGVSLIVFFVVLLWNPDFRIPALAALILLLAGGTFFGLRSIKTQMRFAQLERPNARLLYWQPAVELWKESFWFGAGAGHYDWRFRPWRHWQLQGRPKYVHNDYLQTLAEYGTVGGGIIGASLLALGWGVFRSWKYVRRTNEIASKPSNRSSIVLGCSVGLAAILVHSAGDFNMHIPANAITAVTLMAIIVSHWRFATERFWFNPGVVGRIFLSLVLLAVCIYLGGQALRMGRQSYTLSKYFKAGTLNEAMAVLQTAHLQDPKNSAVLFEAGEQLRLQGFRGNDGYEKLLQKAIPWLENSGKLNRWNPYVHMNLGMCYHWLNQRGKAADHFDRALALDPMSYYMLAMYGWHKIQLGEWHEARKYLDLSSRFNWWDDHEGKKYLKIVERRLAEQTVTR